MTISGVVTTLGGRFGLTLVQFTSTIILARLLSPDDFGLIGMVVPVTLLLSVFRDAGLSTATIQAKDLSHEQISGLFWANVLFGAVCASLLMLASPWVAAFFDRPELDALTKFYAGTLLISSLSVQHEALLRRRMAFGQLMIVGFVSAIISASLAIWLAWLGKGYWALVAMAYANAVVILVATWLLVRWRPGLPRRGVGLRKLVHFGGYIAGSNLLYLCSEQVAPVVLGRMMGAFEVGLYGRAARLTEQFVDQFAAALSQVLLPAFSKLQDDSERMRRALFQVIEKTSVVTFAFAGLLIVGGDRLVILLFGLPWRDAGTLVQALAVGALVWPISRTLSLAMTGLGRSRELFFWSCCSLLIRASAILTGALVWGLTGVAVCYAASQWVGALLFSLFVSRYLPVKTIDILLVIRPMAIAVAIAVGVGLSIEAVVPIEKEVLGTLIVFSMFGIVYLTMLYIMQSGRRILLEIMQIISELLRRTFGHA